MTAFKLLLSIFLILKLASGESCGKIPLENLNFLIYKDHFQNFTKIGLKEIKNLVQSLNEKPTVLYAFDFLESSESYSTKTIVEAYLKRGDHNILVLDYGNYSGGNYIFDAIPNAIKIGSIVGATLVDLKTQNVDIENFHLVGFSLGAHLMSQVGRTVQELSNNTLKIKRITGLDPALPAFFPLNPFITALNKNDAHFVDIIHTDATNFGSSVATGSADFWPNGGTDQPGCPLFDPSDILIKENLCSHLRSVEYFAETVRNPSKLKFPSVLCDSWQTFYNSNCLSRHLTPISHLGIDADPNVRGNFYLQTNNDSEYSRGRNGLIFIDDSVSPQIFTPFIFVK